MIKILNENKVIYVSFMSDYLINISSLLRMLLSARDKQNTVYVLTLLTTVYFYCVKRAFTEPSVLVRHLMLFS